MSISQNLFQLTQPFPPRARLVAVSKFHSKETILEAYNCGQRVFGESRVQELLEKQAQLPADVEWHFIGHLQTNKIKYLVPFVSLIHAVDSFRLLKSINKEAAKIARVVPVLLQIHIAQEETKFGFSAEECIAMLDEGLWRNLPFVQIKGLMGMASNTSDKQRIRAEFVGLSTLFTDIQTRYFDASSFTELSMGMSNDYLIALEEHSTLVRIGSALFGDRD